MNLIEKFKSSLWGQIIIIAFVVSSATFGLTWYIYIEPLKNQIKAKEDTITSLRTEISEFREKSTNVTKLEKVLKEDISKCQKEKNSFTEKHASLLRQVKQYTTELRSSEEELSKLRTISHDFKSQISRIETKNKKLTQILNNLESEKRNLLSELENCRTSKDKQITSEGTPGESIEIYPKRAEGKIIFEDDFERSNPFIWWEKNGNYIVPMEREGGGRCIKIYRENDWDFTYISKDFRKIKGNIVIEAEIQAENIVPNPDANQYKGKIQAMILVNGIPVAHPKENFVGTFGFEKKLFRVSSLTGKETIVLRIGLQNVTGTMWVDNVKVYFDQ